MYTCVGLRSVILAFPGHFQLLSCIIYLESFFFFFYNVFSQAVGLKSRQSSVHFMVALIRLQGKTIPDSFQNVLNKPLQFYQNIFLNRDTVSTRPWHYIL